MPLLVNSVPNLVQGVSQQPDSLRHPAQSDEQINAFSSVVEGLIKRPSTEFVSKLYDDNTNASSLFTHFVKRDENTKYCITVSLGNVSLGGVGVFNLEDGTNYPVAVTSIAGSYLSLGSSVTNPLADLRALTVADYTFLVNKKRVVQKASDAYSKTPEEKALIVVKLGDYEKNYTVYINGEKVSHRSVTNLKYNHPPELDDPVTGTYESGPAQGGQGWHADTNIIAHDLALILEDHLTNTGQIGSINITNGGNSWFNGGDTGTGYGEVNEVYTDLKFGFIPVVKTRKVTRTFERKLELEITQASTGAKAVAVLQVEGGVITSGAIEDPGANFDLVGAITYSYKPKERIKKDGVWPDEWETHNSVDNPDYFDVANTTITAGGIQSSTAFSVEREGSVIQITSTAGPFEVRVEDGLGNQGLGVIYKEVASITDLPLECFNRFIVKVGGDPELAQDDYYVRFSTKNKKEGFGEGRWLETVGWYSDGSGTGGEQSLPTLLADGSMPVTLIPFFKSTGIAAFRLESPNEPLLIRHSSNYYFLKKDHTAETINEPGTGSSWREFWQVASLNSPKGYLDWESGVHYYGGLEQDKGVGWAARRAGDNNTNPFPSFVGKTINDIFFFKNRLGILTDSHVIFSEADEYYNFFRTTTQQLLDSAPIDVGLSHTKVARLKYAKAFQEKLMLFSDTSQFTLRGADILSPKTVAISPVSEYDVSDVVEPLALGNYIYFPFKRDKYEGVYEYFVDNNTEVFTAQEITEQVPKYIRSNVIRMAGSSIQNVLVLQSDRDDSELYIYKYFWSNNEKVQSAWQRFDLRHCNIRGFQFIDSILYLVTEVNDTIQLEKLSFEDAQEESVHALHSFRGNLGYPLLLDSKVVNDAASLSPNMSSSYDATANLTTITGIDIYIPPAESETTLELWTTNGKKYDVTRVSDTSVEFEGAIYDYVSYEGTIYKCMLSHNSSFYPEFNGTPDNYKPGGSQTLWNTLTGDEAALVTSASDWQEDRWYQGPHDFVVGYSYGMLYRFSDQTLKQPTERGGRTTSDYTFQSIKNGSVQYSQSGSMQVAVTPKYRDRFVYTFNPDSVGSNLLINKFTPQDGHFRFPVQTQAEDLLLEVRSESALPLRLLSAEFESLVVSRSRRYGA